MNFHFSKIETRMICFKFGRLLPSGFGEKNENEGKNARTNKLHVIHEPSVHTSK